jgi:hypothetical protein
MIRGMSHNLALPDSEIAERLFELEKKLDLVLSALKFQGQRSPEPEWLTPDEFAPLVGLRNGRTVVYHIRNGRIHSDAVENTGSEERPRYRLHRYRAVDQFLNKA